MRLFYRYTIIHIIFYMDFWHEKIGLVLVLFYIVE